MTQYSDEEDLIPLSKSSSSESESEVSENENSSDELKEDDEISDSDAEPESFSFSATQKSREQTQKLTAKAIKLQKEELKRKRKEIFLQNLKQREEKRQKLASKRLPDHILEKLDDDLEASTEESKEIPVDKKKETETEVIQTSGNVIFKCKVLPSEMQKKREIPKNIAHFKEQMLYGNRIKREKSTRHAVLKQEKRHLKR